MIVVRIIQWIAGIAGLGALTLGLLHWIARISFIEFHMLFGITLTLALLILGILAVATKGIRLLGVGSIVYALIIPVFGVTQQSILVGDLHWVIQVAHLLVGLGALALTGQIGTRYRSLKQASPRIIIPPQVVRS